ncbi:unnamed protein product [Caretta caretta]
MLLLCSLIFLPRQLRSVIHLPDSKEFDVCFYSVKESEQFWEKIGEKALVEQVWVGFVTIPLFKPAVKTVTVFFHTDVVREEDGVSCSGHGEEPDPWIRHTKDSQPLPLDSPVHSLQPATAYRQDSSSSSLFCLNATKSLPLDSQPIRCIPIPHA